MRIGGGKEKGGGERRRKGGKKKKRGEGGKRFSSSLFSIHKKILYTYIFSNHVPPTPEFLFFAHDHISLSSLSFIPLLSFFPLPPFFLAHIFSSIHSRIFLSLSLLLYPKISLPFFLKKAKRTSHNKPTHNSSRTAALYTPSTNPRRPRRRG